MAKPLLTPTLELAQALIARPSVTPDDAGCQQLMAERLAAIGFDIEPMPFGDVHNLWARRGRESPLFCFAGHTDVVPPGPDDAWRSPPFTPTLDGKLLYGRGAADMKGSLAAMVVAAERFVADHADHHGSIAFLITSDEEGPAVDGTVRVVDTLARRGDRIDWCLVGEPSCSDTLGDVVKNGRRGSLNGRLRIRGVQGHVAYPDLARNPVHEALRALAELAEVEWDRGNAHFPPTGFQISNVHAGTGTTNVIPGTLDILFNFRFSTELTEQALRERVAAILDRHDLDYELEWTLSGHPFLTPAGRLVDTTRAAIRAVTGIDTQLSTAGGTSDGRFIAPTGAEVVEFGPRNATIHKVNECVETAHLEQLTDIYQRILESLLVRA